MINLITGKRPNGRQMLILILEPQDIAHIKTGQVATADTSKVEGYDVIVSYAPDAERLVAMLKQELPSNMDAQKFQRIMAMAQQYPEVYRSRKSELFDYNRQDADVKKN